jgi:heptosyltransferase-1
MEAPQTPSCQAKKCENRQNEENSEERGIAHLKIVPGMASGRLCYNNPMSSPPISRRAVTVSSDSPAAPPGAAIDSSALRRLLIVKLSSLGDVVHALPLLDSLRAGFGPDVELAWAVRGKFADLLRANPAIDQLYTLDGRGVRALRDFGATLRGGHFDAALDTQGLLLSGALTYLSRAPVRLGLDRNREGNRLFLTHAVVPGRQRAHIVDILLGFCDALGLPRHAPQAQRYLAEGEADHARELIGRTADEPVAAFIVGASTPDKTWPVAHWAAAANRLRRQGVRVVLVGGPGEAADARAVIDAAPGTVAANLVGATPLPVLASVLAQCDVVIGGDSGPTHLAVAVGAPVVGLYGVTDPVRTGPCWGPAPAIVLDYAERDAPPALRRPRHGALPDALSRIPPEAVAAAALSLLAGRADNAS